jgi:hypothetical protein
MITLTKKQANGIVLDNMFREACMNISQSDIDALTGNETIADLEAITYNAYVAYNGSSTLDCGENYPVIM